MRKGKSIFKKKLSNGSTKTVFLSPKTVKKLTDQQICGVLELYTNDESIENIAKKYETTNFHIKSIIEKLSYQSDYVKLPGYIYIIKTRFGVIKVGKTSQAAIDLYYRYITYYGDRIEVYIFPSEDIDFHEWLVLKELKKHKDFYEYSELFKDKALNIAIELCLSLIPNTNKYYFNKQSNNTVSTFLDNRDKLEHIKQLVLDINQNTTIEYLSKINTDIGVTQIIRNKNKDLKLKSFITSNELYHNIDNVIIADIVSADVLEEQDYFSINDDNYFALNNDKKLSFRKMAIAELYKIGYGNITYDFMKKYGNFLHYEKFHCYCFMKNFEGDLYSMNKCMEFYSSRLEDITKKYMRSDPNLIFYHQNINAINLLNILGFLNIYDDVKFTRNQLIKIIQKHPELYSEEIVKKYKILYYIDIEDKYDNFDSWLALFNGILTIYDMSLCLKQPYKKRESYILKHNGYYNEMPN